MKMLGYVDDDKLEETYLALNEQDLEKLKDELKGTFSDVYVVVDATKTLPYPEVYSDKSVRVYKI